MPSYGPVSVLDPPLMPQNQHAWTVLLLSSWLLLGRLAINASEHNCDHFSEARLDLFCSEDWLVLWAWSVPSVIVLVSGRLPKRPRVTRRSRASAKCPLQPVEVNVAEFMPLLATSLLFLSQLILCGRSSHCNPVILITYHFVTRQCQT